jgi:hypothetical protein
LKIYTFLDSKLQQTFPATEPGGSPNAGGILNPVTNKFLRPNLLSFSGRDLVCYFRLESTQEAPSPVRETPFMISEIETCTHILPPLPESMKALKASAVFSRAIRSSLALIYPFSVKEHHRVLEEL